jgi:hypothetical protein
MIRKYKYGDAIDTITSNAKLGTFVLQYEETDWAFLKRLASRFGSVLVPEVTAASPKVFFGMPEGKLYKVERDVSYQVRRTFHELKAGKPGKRAGSYMTYVIESLQYYALGDIIALPIGSGKELVVVRAVTRLEDGLLHTRYDLQAEQDIRYARYENDQAAGIALTGTVLKVQQDLVQLQLDIDSKQDPAKACWFPVATHYVAEEHSGWYDMPEAGERVGLYLPTSREHEAYVTDSQRQHRHTTGQPDVKAWRHAQGSGVDMSGQELTLSTSGAFSITLHDGSGIIVSSPGDVQIQGGHVKLDAGEGLSLKAGSSLYLRGGASSMVLDGETDIKAPVVDQEGTVKAPVFVMDLPPVPEPPLMNIKDYEAAQAAAVAKTQSSSTPTAKITSPADQKQADGLLSTTSKLLGSIPVVGAMVGATLGGLAAASASLMVGAAIPVRSTGTSRAGGGGANGGVHPLKYLAGLALQGLISHYEHEKAKDAYYRKWMLGKVFTSARELGLPTSWKDMASYVRRMAQTANELEQAYHQIPSELRQRWRANYDRYMAEQPQPQPKQEQSRSWLAILGEAQLQNAEAQVAAGKYVAEVVGEATSGAGTAVVEDYSLGIMSKEYASNHPKARKTGELIGHLITTVAGVLEMGAAATEAVFGGVVTSTGALAPIGVGAIVQSTVVGTHGAGVTFIGGSNSVKSAKDLYQMFKSEGTPGRASSKTSADSIRKNLNNEILDEMEAKGGHLLEKHVGKTNEELLKRAAQEGVPSTTFSNKSTALKATQENIRKNADQISDWLDNPNSKGYLITKTEHNYPVGKGVDVKNGGNSASKKVNNNLSKSQLYLVKDPSMTSGYRIITGYPVFD